MLVSLYFPRALVVTILVCLAMEHVVAVKRTLCMEQINARVLHHGFVRIFSKRHLVMMMKHPSELK